MKHLVGAVDHDVADRRIGEQFLERPEAEQLVDQHLFERELLAAVEVDLELGQHLADDRAEFLGQLVLAERRRGFGIDPLEQARKHLLLDPVDRGLEAFRPCCCRCFAAGVLALVEAIQRAHVEPRCGWSNWRACRWPGVPRSAGIGRRPGSSTGARLPPPLPFIGRATPKFGR